MSNRYEAFARAIIEQASHDKRAQPWNNSADTQAVSLAEEWIEINQRTNQVDVRENAFPMGEVDARTNSFPMGYVDARINAFPMGAIDARTNASPIGDEEDTAEVNEGARF
ncbi:hypothetical protein G7Y89_g1345 [Cudoniella acicularis]|uniref:Uncharacterized protein n=1 Tax=Cudoniella acicularis TaxID=354080 RepID=A0A8H4W805_9HELO|nr:hypothetical protein G7Y89_g1345 [Cudoniella acicularis]